MPQVVFPLDSSKKFTDQKIVGHNRWHPDIPAQVKVKPGDSFRVDCARRCPPVDCRAGPNSSA